MKSNSGNEIERLFNQMLVKGLVSTSNYWIERATELKNPRLTLDLASSTVLFYDKLDKKLIEGMKLN